MGKRPSIYKIILVDYVALVAALFPIILWGMYVLLDVFNPTNPPKPSFKVWIAGITIIAFCVFVWRIRQFILWFDDGIEVSGKINNIFFFRDRGRVDFEYTYQGEKFTSRSILHKVKQTTSLRVGDQVTVMIDRNNPKRAIIRDLYI